MPRAAPEKEHKLVNTGKLALALRKHSVRIRRDSTVASLLTRSGFLPKPSHFFVPSLRSACRFFNANMKDMKVPPA